jgi:2'-5' RNA ligase
MRLQWHHGNRQLTSTCRSSADCCRHFFRPCRRPPKGVPPHITLLYPWRPAPLGQQDLSAAAAAIAGTTPFTLRFNRLGRFSSLPGTLYLQPEPDAPLRSLIRTLTRAFPDTPPYEGRFLDPVPHLTVARAETASALEDLATAVMHTLQTHLPLLVRVRYLVVQEEGEDGTWTVRATLPLDGK